MRPAGCSVSRVNPHRVCVFRLRSGHHLLWMSRKTAVSFLSSFTSLSSLFMPPLPPLLHHPLFLPTILFPYSYFLSFVPTPLPPTPLFHPIVLILSLFSVLSYFYYLFLVFPFIHPSSSSLVSLPSPPVYVSFFLHHRLSSIFFSTPFYLHFLI